MAVDILYCTILFRVLFQKLKLLLFEHHIFVLRFHLVCQNFELFMRLRHINKIFMRRECFWRRVAGGWKKKLIRNSGCVVLWTLNASVMTLIVLSKKCGKWHERRMGGWGLKILAFIKLPEHPHTFKSRSFVPQSPECFLSICYTHFARAANDFQAVISSGFSIASTARCPLCLSVHKKVF